MRLSFGSLILFTYLCTVNSDKQQFKSNKIMATIKIGTTVKYRPYGGNRVKTAKVTNIDECPCGEKSGEPADEVEFKYRAGNFAKGVEYIFGLDDDHLCYGEQIIGIVK